MGQDGSAGERAHCASLLASEQVRWHVQSLKPTEERMARERLTSDLSPCVSWGVAPPSSAENRTSKSCYDGMGASQWVKCLPSKHEDLSSDPSSHVKSWIWYVFAIPAHGR